MKSRKIARSLAATLAITLLLATGAWAKPKVTIEIQAEKEITVVEKGKSTVKRIPATAIQPGEIAIYTIAYANIGDEIATNVVIDDPIPEGTAYLPGSATEVGEVSFSIDGGKTYKKPSLLTYEVTLPDGTKEKRVASPEQYTHIRWQIPQVAVGAKNEVSFRVKVK